MVAAGAQDCADGPLLVLMRQIKRTSLQVILHKCAITALAVATGMLAYPTVNDGLPGVGSRFVPIRTVHDAALAAQVSMLLCIAYYGRWTIAQHHARKIRPLGPRKTPQLAAASAATATTTETSKCSQ